MESKWIIWTFVPTLTWAGWIHAGIRAKHTKYFMIAALYGIPFMLAMIFSEDKSKANGESSKTYDAVIILSMLVWVGGIVHAQVVKKEVNLRIKYASQASASTGGATDGELERRIAAEYGVQTLPPNASNSGQPAQPQAGMTPDVPQPPSRAMPPPPVVAQASGGPSDAAGVDVNNAGEEAIAALPGVGPILAKKAIKIRQSQGGFESVEQFAQLLGLKPHVVGQIRLRIVIGPFSAQAPGVVKEAIGRVVDF